MTSNAITEAQDKIQTGSSAGAPGSEWKPGAPLAPSIMAEDEPTIARIVGTVGGALTIFGGIALWFNLSGNTARVGTGLASILFTLGLAGLLFHAAFDRDTQFRRMYMALGYLLMAVGVIGTLLPLLEFGGYWLGVGAIAFLLGLVLILCFLKHETELPLRNGAQAAIGGVGLVAAVVGLLGGHIRPELLLPTFLVLSLVGLLYLAAFVATRSTADEVAYRVGMGLGAVGLVVFLVALGRASLPALWHAIRGEPIPVSTYLVPAGFIHMMIGTLYFLVAVGLCWENSLAVMTRRELGSFFYSPVAYIVFVVFTCGAWFGFFQFMLDLIRSEQPLVEPIIAGFFFSLGPVLCLGIVVPVLTMRLLSEENRSGTLEVLLTAPVSETSVVMSKFLSALFMYLLMWVPFGLILMSLPLAGARPFDYRPLFSFFFALLITGAGFVSMGLFFSSLTKSQVAAAVLTFAGMLGLTSVYIIRIIMGRMRGASPGLMSFLEHISYLDVWSMTLEGKLVPRALLFFASMTVLFLFLTVKVLESRKWR